MTNPRLLLEKTTNVNNVCPGDTVSYTIRITNIGNKIGQNLKINDTLPDGFTLKDPDGASSFAKNLGDINSNEVKEITYEAIVDNTVPSAIYANSAVATLDFVGPPYNHAQASAEVKVGLCPNIHPLLTIEKSADKKVANPGQTVQFTIVVANAGNTDLIDVTVTDVIPQGFTASIDPVSWPLGNLTPGQTETITFPASANEKAADGNYINIATAQAQNHGPVSDEEVVRVQQGAVLGVEFTQLPDMGMGMKMVIYFVANILALLFGVALYHKTKRYMA